MEMSQKFLQEIKHGNSLVSEICLPLQGGTGSIPGQGAKIPHARWHSQQKMYKN